MNLAWHESATTCRVPIATSIQRYEYESTTHMWEYKTTDDISEEFPVVSWSTTLYLGESQYTRFKQIVSEVR